MNELKPTIEREGQEYVDDPVFVDPVRSTPIERSLAAAYGRKLPQPIQVGHERVRLQWMKSDGRGGLVPR
jgi:hypothetical protein